MRKVLLVVSSVLLSACLGVPEQVSPVTPFDPARYQGTWYELARLDHSFERGLSQVTATYQARSDGGFTVINRGYSAEKDRWKSATGRAYLVAEPDVGHLKVSFFRPFYSSYVIFGLDDNYQHAFVSGFNHNYLWLLSRTPTISPAVKAEFERSAREKGFDISGLIYVEQSP